MRPDRTATRPVRVYHRPQRSKEGGGYHYPREVLHERGVLHQFSIESTELDTGAAHCPVGVVELPDGTVITTPAHLIQFLDVARWKPVTGPGQVHHGDRVRFTIGDKQHQQRAKSILNWGTDKEEVIYDRGQNYYFITSMVANGTSNHKNVEYFDTRGE